MKQFKVATKFYVIFSLLFAIPASHLSTLLQNYLSSLGPNNIFQQLASLGVIEIPTTAILLVGVFWLIDKWILKIKWLPLIFNIPHDVNGRYEGTLISNYDSTQTYKVVIEIKQSLTSISVNLYSESSPSHSIVAAIGRNYQDNWAVYYLYQNNPNTVNHDEDMKDHYGAAFLEVFDKAERLVGHYFNNPRDRGRHGSIDVKRVGKTLLGRLK